MIEGFYLPPSLAAGVETTVHRFGPAHDATAIRLPLFLPGDLTRWIEALRRARREHLADRPIATILRPLERVVARHLDPRDRGRRALVAELVQSGRFSQPMIERALDDAFEPLARGDSEVDRLRAGIARRARQAGAHARRRASAP